jgi:hypothetical protein
VDPPPNEGATGEEGDVDKLPSHPPLAVVVRSHAANEASIIAWDWPVGSVLSMAQVKDTAVAFGTVNVAVQVFSSSQPLVTAHVTVL